MAGSFTRAGVNSPFLRALIARRTLVIGMTVAGLLVSLLWVAVRSPKYEASAEVLMSPLPQEDQNFLGLQLLRDSGDPTRTAATAAALIRSHAAAGRTARALGAGWTQQSVLKAVHVTPQSGSNLLDVTAKADEADVAQRLANTFVRTSLATRRRALAREARAELARVRPRLSQIDATTEAGANFVASIDRLEAVSNGRDPTLSLSQAATRPGAPSGLPAGLIVALGVLLGFGIGSGAAWLLESVNKRVRDENEALGMYELPVLARVPKLKARELRERPGPWTLPPAVREAFRTLMLQLREKGDAGGVIVLTSASSRDGKTTSSVNLAASLAAAGNDCVLLDLDLRKPDIGRLLHITRGPEVAALQDVGGSLSELLVPAPGLPSLSVLATQPTESDVILVDAINRRIPELIQEARGLAQYVVIDTAPLGEVGDALRVVGEADEVVVVVRPGSTTRAGFEVLRDLLERVGHRPAGMLLIGAPGGATSSYYGYGATRRELTTSPLARVRSR
jgi:Mrp family chromosome partitioning ATPase